MSMLVDGINTSMSIHHRWKPTAVVLGVHYEAKLGQAIGHKAVVVKVQSGNLRRALEEARMRGNDQRAIQNDNIKDAIKRLLGSVRLG